MAVGLASAVAAALLDALANQSNYTAPTALWIELHTAEPGAAGTTAVAGNATRKDITTAFGAASGGTCTTTVDITWSSGEVDTSEDYTHYAIFSASTAGTFYWSGPITANAVVTGDQFKILAGDLDLSLSTAA